MKMDGDINGNTFIGLCYHEEKGYCTKCKTVFKYGYNIAGLCGGLHKGEGNCPNCGAGDTYGDVIRSDHIELQIDLIRGLAHCDLTDDKQRKKLRHDISELNRIRRLFDKYDEEHSVMTK